MANLKIGILTGGGDAPGLNAAIYGIVKTCLSRLDCEIVGYKLGYRGLLENNFIPLTDASVSGILNRGGTILRNSNKDNLFNFPVGNDEHGNIIHQDVSNTAIENLQRENVDILIVLGGDGTLTSARDFARKGVRVIGVPKTIDNDLASTDITFGFDTAVNIVTEALGRLHTTAESHHRVIVTEVMGRYAGWIPLHAGIAGSADVILLPEFPYDIQKIVQKIKSRADQGKYFTIVIAGEGARAKDGEITVSKIVKDSPDSIRLGGIGAKLAYDLEPLVDHEVRSVALGHIQRGGETSAFDRILSLRYAHHVAHMIEQEQFGRMVALKNGQMCSESLENVIGNSETGSTAKANTKQVTLDHELVRVALGLGITFAN